MRGHDTGTLWDGSLGPAPHCQLSPGVPEGMSHAMFFRGRPEAVGIQEQGCSWPLGLGKQMTWEGSMPCGRSAALQALSLATSHLCAELVPFFPLDPRC